MNEFAPGTGKVFHTLAKHASTATTSHEFNREWGSEYALPFFCATPNSDALFNRKIDSQILQSYAIESVGVRDYLKNIFIQNSQHAADAVNTMIRYRVNAGDNPMQSVIFAFKNTDRPLNGKPFDSPAFHASKKLPAINSQDYQSLVRFLEPSTSQVTSGRNKGNGRRDPGFIYGALPLMWTLDLMDSAKEAKNPSWQAQRNSNCKWFWIATAFEYIKTVGKAGYDAMNVALLYPGAYVLGDYFRNLGLDNASAKSIEQFGYKLLRTYDYASTAKTLMLIKEANRPNYFSSNEVRKIKLTYEDVVDVLEYESRLNDYLRLSGGQITEAEKKLAETLSIKEIRTLVNNFAEKNTHFAFTHASTNTLETTADNEFTLRENTGTFVKNVVLEGVAKDAGVTLQPVPA